MRIDFRRCCGFVFAASLLSSVLVQAQPYHSDVMLGSEQTLQVEGNALIKQYGSGLGGNLTVVGDSSFAAGGIALTGLPSGVTGTFYGTHKIGTALNTAEYRFSKTGTSSTGDFIAPLGVFEGSGPLIQLEVMTGPHDANSGGASFSLMSKRHSYGPVTAVSHAAYAGGRGVKVHAYNAHGATWLFLEFDGSSNSPEEIGEHALVVKVSVVGSIDPQNHSIDISQAYPVALENSYSNSSINVGETTQSINTDKIALNGDVTIASGKSLKIGTSDVLTTSFAPTSSAAWTNAFLPRGTVSNGASLAMGTSSAMAPNAVALGYLTGAAGSGAFATGKHSYAEGAYSMASGEGTWTWGYASTSLGQYTIAYGTGSIAAGIETIADSYASAAFGANNRGGGSSMSLWVEEDPLFEVGNSPDWGVPSNAITICKNGETTVTNKAWKANQDSTSVRALADPPATNTDANGRAFVVEGHTQLKGKVIIDIPQGDISMGPYQ